MSAGNRPQDLIPYEYRMKYIIEDYRRISEALEMIEPYTRELEETVKRQQHDLDVIRDICGVNHVHEVPKYLERLLDEGRYKKLERKYEKLKGDYWKLAENIKMYEDYKKTLEEAKLYKQHIETL